MLRKTYFRERFQIWFCFKVPIFCPTVQSFKLNVNPKSKYEWQKEKQRTRTWKTIILKYKLNFFLPEIPFGFYEDVKMLNFLKMTLGKMDEKRFCYLLWVGRGQWKPEKWYLLRSLWKEKHMKHRHLQHSLLTSLNLIQALAWLFFEL